MSKVSQIITETVLKRMEEAEKNGEVFYWVKPFSEGSPNKPYSYDTGIPYRGINRILLDNDEFLTFAKVQEMNKKKDAVQYHIRKGAKASMVKPFVLCVISLTTIMLLTAILLRRRKRKH